MDFPEVVTSSMMTTRSPSLILLPSSSPASPPWSFASFRLERGKGDKSAHEEIQETYGFPANAIVTMEDVITYLYNRPCQGKIQIDDKMKAAIDAYYEEYGVK